eukprot:COSAG05_NODE_1032_length_6088_cov_23.885624_2_plen_378_part_00
MVFLTFAAPGLCILCFRMWSLLLRLLLLRLLPPPLPLLLLYLLHLLLLLQKLPHLVLLLSTLHADMLVVEDFFYKLERNYHEACKTCSTAVISGYTSNIMMLAYGAHFMFNQRAFHMVVRNISTPIVDAWDHELGTLHTSTCGEWPTRPVHSLAHHMASVEGTHYARDGDSEYGLGFEWDEYNQALKIQAINYFNFRWYRFIQQRGLKTTADIDKCFVGQYGKVLMHCAAVPRIMMDYQACLKFSKLSDALRACLGLETCGGVMADERRNIFTLHSDRNMELPTENQLLPNCRNRSESTVWLRQDRVHGKNADGAREALVCTADPTTRSPALLQSMYDSMRRIRQRCATGYFLRCSVGALWNFEPDFLQLYTTPIVE